MLHDILLTPEEIALKAEVREFVRREVSSDLIRNFEGVSFKVADAITALDPNMVTTVK